MTGVAMIKVALKYTFFSLSGKIANEAARSIYIIKNKFLETLQLGIMMSFISSLGRSSSLRFAMLLLCSVFATSVAFASGDAMVVEVRQVAVVAVVTDQVTLSLNRRTSWERKFSKSMSFARVALTPILNTLPKALVPYGIN